MQKIDASKFISSYRLLKSKIENKNKSIHHHFKSTNVSKERIYFFRTSLFTDKSKKMIQKMNSSQTKTCKDINEKKEIIAPPIRPECRTSYKEGLIRYILEKKNENDENIKRKENNQITANVANLDNKGKNDNKVDDKINQRLRKSYKNLMKINFNIGNNTEIKNCQNDQKENIFNKDNYQKNNYKIINDIKKCKLFSTFNTIIINNKNNNNNKNIAFNNQLGQSLSRINDKISNSNTKKKESNQNKDVKISDYNKKIIYRLKSRKSIKKGKKNITAISYKSININDNNIKKGNKSISKYCKIPSISVFDDSCYISKYKLGNYIIRRKNNRYDSRKVIGDDKINIKKFIKSGINNISAFKNKDDFRLSRRDKNA